MTFPAADPTDYSRGSARRPASRMPQRHIVTLPVCISPRCQCRGRADSSRRQGESRQIRAPTDHRGDRGWARRQQTAAPRRAQKKGSPADSASARAPRGTAATYSPGWWASTIGADELNGSVRDGKRWDLIALTTAAISLERPQPGFRGKDIGPLVRVGFAIAGFTPPAYQRRRLRRPSSEVSSWRRLRA